ncbi:tropomyosin-2-like [Clytia hemisphaerica]|uniref:tropomyosin-2-like n=1 Tax=Clytia hemisphaerica TaxID=252671 RepID=UPI0034D508D0
MDALRIKMEKLVQKIDDTDGDTEDKQDMVKSLENKISENELVSEDLRRRIKAVRLQLTDIQNKTKKAEDKAIEYEKQTKENNQRISVLTEEADLRDEYYVEIEEKMCRAKLDHMELSGAFQDARSRSQLLFSEIEKVKSLKKTKQNLVEKLEGTIRRKSEQLDKLTETNVQNENFERDALKTTQSMDSCIKENKSKEALARSDIERMEKEIESKQIEINEKRLEREKIESELQELVDDLDEV